ncbi:MAG: ATP-binding protein [Myxococcota bacterium]|jgi:signal transduction histidine kinase|nr:ATP-binding protein [Myxococcota bacterium]
MSKATASMLPALTFQEQARQLLRSEQRLFRLQKRAEQQLERIHAVNEYALAAASAFETTQILDGAIATLMSLFALEQGLAWVLSAADDEAAAVSLHPSADEKPRVPASTGFAADTPASLVCRRSLYAFDPSQSPPPIVFPRALARRAPLLLEAQSVGQDLAQVFDTAFRSPRRGSSHALYVLIPLYGQRCEGLLGLLALRHVDTRQATPHDKLPDASDLPFLELIMRHAQCALENALLHERLSRFASSLELKVSRRTQALSTVNRQLEANLVELKETQDQLIQASKMAAIGTLVAGLSHELNTPLGVIMGYAQGLLEKRVEPEVLHQGLETIQRQTQRCKQLVASLLRFVRRSPTCREQVGAGQLVGRVHELCMPFAKHERVEVAVHRLEPLPFIEVNDTEIETALLNLVNNALDASSPGDTVELGARSEQRNDRDGVVFWVADSGCGIPNEAHRWIFDPFYTTKERDKGTGLGLAITRRIVEAHQGEIHVESIVGKGTTMLLWLPCA